MRQYFFLNGLELLEQRFMSDWHCPCLWCGYYDQVYTEGRLIVEFNFDDLMRIRSWHFAIRNHRELIPRSVIAMQVNTGLSLVHCRPNTDLWLADPAPRDSHAGQSCWALPLIFSAFMMDVVLYLFLIFPPFIASLKEKSCLVCEY